MGRLTLQEIVPLAQANQPGAADVDWSLYLWMTDVQLQMPTPWGPITQAGDEYAGEGVISKPASFVANVASHLSRIPIIGRFARATEIGAGAVSRIASIFGFSRPTQLADLTHFRPRLFGPLAVTEGADLSHKMTLDPKNELTVDPRVVGVEGKDDMALANIITRPGLVGFVNWTAS